MEEKQILYIDFATLKQSYIEVKNFLEKTTKEKVENVDVLIEKDLFLSGLDNLTDKWRETIVTGIRGSGKTTVISDIIGKSSTRDDVVVISGWNDPSSLN